METPKSIVILFVVFAIALTACHFPTPETQVVEGGSIEQLNLEEVEEIEIEVFTPTPAVSLEEEILEVEQEEAEPHDIQEEIAEEPEVELERITRSLVGVLIDSEVVTPWYSQYWRNLELINLRCGNQCSVEEIEELLGPVFTKEEWTVVQIGRVLYTHSGWGHNYGPEFGEIFRRIIRENDSEPFRLCLAIECYEFVDYEILGREELENTLVISQIFDENQETDRFILTCDGFVDENILTPKLVIQLRLINP